MRRFVPALLGSTLGVGLSFLGACITSTTTSGNDGGNGIFGDGGAAPDTSGQIPMGDGGPCMVATTLPDGNVLPYVPVAPSPNACSPSQIANFAGNCIGSSVDAAACDAFQTDPANASCIAKCLLPIDDAGAHINSGGVLVDYTGTSIVGVNVPGCVALADPEGGAACAQVLEPYFQCETQACSSANCRSGSAAAYGNCIMSSTSGVCAGYYNASSPCSPEYAEGGAAVTACASSVQVLTRICGSGM